MKKIYLSVRLSIALVFLAALSVTFLSFYIQPCAIAEVFEIFRRTNYFTALLNFLPVFMIMLLLFFVSGSVSLSVSAPGITVLILSFVNRYKITLRGDPFFFYDFALAPELIGVIKSFGARFIIIVALLCTAAIAAAVFVIYIVRTKKMPAVFRIAGVFVALAVIISLNATVYRDKKLYFELPVIGNMYNDKDIFISKGFVYCFVYTFNISSVEKPHDYDKKIIAQFMDNHDPTIPEGAVKPNIIIIMSEAFSEISMNPVFNFDGYIDPLANYKKIISEPETISGKIIVPSYGGGTGDTEFDALTAVNSRFLRGAPFVYRLIVNEIEALPKWLKNIGYDAVAVHPGHGWFYNRQNVYSLMGFDIFYHLRDFENAKLTRAGYVTEESCFDKIIELYENKTPGAPLFLFTVTIEAHGPYDTYYGTPTNFNSDAEFSVADTNAVSDYFERMISADAQLKRLTDFLNDDPEPAVLLFFGDHMPAFYPSAVGAIFGEPSRDTLENRFALYTTPFLIWRNNAAIAQIPFTNEPSAGHETTISSFYLTPYLMRLIGFENISPAVKFAASVMENFPVVVENEFYDSFGGLFQIESSDEMKFLKNHAYYSVFERH